MATVTVQDLAVLRYCARGARAACAEVGIDYLDFVHNGIHEDILRQKTKPGDEMVEALITAAKTREAMNG